MLDTSEKLTQNTYKEPKDTSNNTLILDNGTFELKAGYQNDLCIIVKNRLYKYKDKTSLDPFASSSAKTMFDSDVIVNFDVLEMVLDQILGFLKPKSLENLIMTVTPNSPTDQTLIETLFDVYKFERIQLGYDFIYCYHRYFDKKDCVIVDLKYSSVIVCVVKDNAIKDIFKIDFGGRDLLEYINYAMIDKYKESRKDYKGLAEFLRVSEDYNKEAITIYHEICSGIYDRNLFLTDSPQHRSEEATEKRHKSVPMPQMTIPQIDTVLINTPDNELDKEQLKEKRRQKMVYFNILSRVKTRIEKQLKELDICISNLKDELEKQTNLKGYISKRKTRFSDLKRDLELRDQLRRDAKNKKTRAFTVKFKEGILSPEEQDLKLKILDAEDEDLERVLITDLERLAAEITELDPEFIPFYANTVEILRGDNLGRQTVNIELIKWPEILFDPSIIGSEQMGLSEIFENIFPQTQIENVLVCGGFSFMKNLESRIRNEVSRLLNSGNVNVVRAEDPQKDPFYGAKFSEMFRIYTREDYANSKL